MDEVTVLGSARGPRGETVLRRRRNDQGTVHELIVNGVFAMDSTDTSSERQLAGFVVRPPVPPGPPATVSPASIRVLVGGLGLGYTAAAVLDGAPATSARPAGAEPGALEAGALEVDALEVDVLEVDVVELEPCLVDWAQQGLTPVLARVATDPRVRLHVGDVAAVLRGAAPEPAGPWDAILLDVDNGPDFLIHHANHALYEEATLQAGYDRLSERGVLAIWCQGPAPQLLSTLQRIGTARAHTYQVERDGRRLCYATYTLHRSSAPPSVPGADADDG